MREVIPYRKHFTLARPEMQGLLLLRSYPQEEAQGAGGYDGKSLECLTIINVADRQIRPPNLGPSISSVRF